MPQPGNPVKLSAAAPYRPAPPRVLGADSQSVFGELLGYDEARLAALRTAGAIA